jgi:glycine C-acetyltransferase
MASIGAFIASDAQVIEYLRYNCRSQIFAKALPMPLVIGALKRLELLRTQPELKDKLWEIVHALQSQLREAGFNIGKTESPVTPVLLNGSIPEAANLIYDLRENFNIFCSMVVYPVVPKGQARIRVQISAGHERHHLDQAIAAFIEVGKELGVIR